MKVRVSAARWILVCLLFVCGAPLFAAPQHANPIKKTGLIDALQAGGLSPAELIEQIDQRGVNFRLAYDDEEDLRNAGASPAVLDAVRKHYRAATVSTADKANAASLLKSSQALLDAHDPTSALPVANQALALDEDDASAFILRSRIYLASGQPKKAVADLNIALEITPGNAEAQRYLVAAISPGASAAAGATGGDIPSAGHVGYMGFRFDQRSGQPVVIGVLPSGAAARGGLLVGDQLNSANGIAMAAFFDQYIKPNKLNPGQTVQLQVVRQGQPLSLQVVVLPRPAVGDEALNFYGQLIQQYPGNPEAYLLRASVNFQLKNLNAALGDLDSFVRLDPGDPTGYQLRASVKTALGDQAGAKSDQDEAARLSAPANNSGKDSQAAAPTLPERWNLVQFNKNFKIKQVGDHVYIQGIDAPVNADAEKTTDKNGNVVYKGKWHQQQNNGQMMQWNFTLRMVTPDRIEGTVLTLIVRGIDITFVPAN
jgi:tetratricopeptide (TPR) repeat protein